MDTLPTVEDCAAACRGVSTMFSYGTNKYGKNRCTSTGCKCLCEKSANQLGTCMNKENSGYNLYSYLAAWEHVSDMNECGGQELMEYLPSIESCARKCQGISTMFAYGTNDFGG